ncbi:DAK2 domain-containing protein [uncultured Anaerobutyricum sp.]|uniref:DAK2 domain-containing protein n=1 Tax=Anaerobutyricum soehngenii TaxID=105843 RepID=UPI00262B2C5E|nr:DAK2 domain-containing protein [uncultured Anaerobutyricum sp.]
MNSHTIDAKSFQKLFLAGANRINSRKDYINELNVFPVPDGDTGTNMSLTILAAAKEVGAVEEPTMATICKAISNGSLRGARGNSGVILSQLFRGFTKAVSKADSLGKDEITAGFTRAVETAYKAVMKPKEGTILTVAKGMADKAEELVDEDMDVIEFCEAIVAYGYEVLSKTPDMLPVLKEAGVVDSGGQGLMEVLQGIVDALTGKVTEIEVPAEAASMSSAVISAPKADISTADIKFGYCTEFIILLDKPLTKEDEKGLKKFFLSIGDSLVLVADEEICKVHVHTNHPGQAFEKALTFGALSNMKIDNMRLEHQEKLIKDAENEAARQRQQEAEEEKLTAQEAAKAQPAKEVGFIAVSAGEGLTDIFKGLGVDYLIEGGQTMNPSTEDMLNAIDQVNAKNIFILPNNKNIILAAEQARDLTEDKKIVVLPTKTIPQGISAMIGYMPEASVDENTENMKDSYQDIASGQVTYAVRDTSIDGKEIHNGDIMGINDGGIAAVGKDLMETTIELLSTMVDEDSELICLYYGADVSKQDADALSDEIEEKFPECEVEVNFGGQPIYYYMISVE